MYSSERIAVHEGLVDEVVYARARVFLCVFVCERAVAYASVRVLVLARYTKVCKCECVYLLVRWLVNSDFS